MSECEGYGFCENCACVQSFFLSGSATKGSCMVCGVERVFKGGEVRVYYHQDADESNVEEVEE